jgi:signal transduction histidine kinase
MAAADHTAQDSVAVWQPSPERLESLAEFAAGAGHEINNPLATILGRAQQLLRDEHDPSRRESLSIIAAQALRVRDMIGDVMTFARPPLPQRHSVAIGPLLHDLTQRLQPVLSSAGCRIQVACPPEFPQFTADPVQVQVVLSELIRNSIVACGEQGGTITLRATADGQHVTLAVEDHGRGFTPLEREHAFDPFYSGRQAGRGLGFGLCKAARIVAMHGGEITIASSPTGPTIVTTCWPLASA